MKKTSIGGQAVMEGVMMKNLDRYAVAVRKPDHEIEVMTDEYKSLGRRYAVLGLPIIRGVVNFGDKLESVLMGITMVISVILALGIFMVLPFFLTNLMKGFLPSYSIRTLIEGIIRVALFLLYIWLISKMEDIKRVFMYHGAEHKTINCLEHGEDLTPENIKKYSRLHKRCGTSFLLIVMIVSIVVFMFIRVDSLLWKFVLRILLVPIVAGISYEFIRLAGRSDSKLVNTLSKPGLYLQYFTTREPDEEMMEVAIKAVEGVFDWKEYLRAMHNGELED